MPLKMTIHHIKDGAHELDAIDAKAAVKGSPDEWSTQPWPAEKPVEKPKPQSDEEIAARAELAAQTNSTLQKLAADEGIAVEPNDSKAKLVDKIIAGRAAKG